MWDIVYHWFANLMLNMKRSSNILYYDTLINYLYLLPGIVISPHFNNNLFFLRHMTCYISFFMKFYKKSDNDYDYNALSRYSR